MSVSEDFLERTGIFRGELLAHCYQMLGSFHDAEDQVQDTFLRAWRAYDRFDDRRASMRTWLYRIATNSCLTALQSRDRRALPSGLGAPADDPTQPLTPGAEAWLQPFPDAMIAEDPAAALLSRGRLRLALVAALQYLPARQRAILILREVLEFSAAEVATMLDTSVAAVNSGLQRARARLAELGVDEEELAEPADTQRRALLDQYVKAFESADIAGLTRLLTEDVVLEMPPFSNWYRGPAAYGGFIARVFAARGTDWRMLLTPSNGQMALAAYTGQADGRYVAHSLQVVTTSRDGIVRNTVFQDPALFVHYGLPALLP
ncbi:sigma-70 family RNA polymerase sigma factor [Micromonospora sp. KC207]|uniref:sigma-70 family RNA polymerase sigma factor n=1 Tax=Micromonospora sp. KC207 TaxID=2530377 RepID=UPI00104CF022|nr:sigma-70 family RNA polymerase sigma factor [Micromonospora sp. KC207]TDC52887.1 sigma-70 family RNA polymerase sigma factor [Micromonospora sp. KC207]